MNRDEWDALQVRKMRAAIKAAVRLDVLVDEQRWRDSEREAPAGWEPGAPVFGSAATDALRRAME